MIERVTVSCIFDWPEYSDPIGTKFKTGVEVNCDCCWEIGLSCWFRAGGWSIEWSVGWFVDLFIGWSIGWSIDWSIGWFIDWSIGWFIGCRWEVRLSGWFRIGGESGGSPGGGNRVCGGRTKGG